MGLLTGKTAIVTGAARGIGKAIALKFASEGANIAFTDLVIDENGQNTEKEIAALGVKVKGYASNAANFEDTEKVVNQIKEDFGSIDILVNNAGINRDGMLHKMSAENWQTVIDVDLTGAFYGTQEAIKYMRPKESGRIINISSGSWLGNIGQANYAAAKAGVVGLTKTAARENARKGITCNAICPGFIETDMTVKLKEVNDGAAWESMISRVPMGYAGKPSDVGNLVAFLASDEAAYITSEVINCGGGMIV